MTNNTGSSKVEWAHEGCITDEAIEEHRRRIGRKFQYSGACREANGDSILRFVNAIGDPNPLWRDEEYARKTRYGGLVAPPSFLYNVTLGLAMHGLKGVHAFHSGTDWEFYKPVVVYDKITYDCTFVGLDEHSSDFAPRWLVEHYQTDYFNRKDDLIARSNAHMIRAERLGMKKKGKYSSITIPHPWTEEERIKIEDEVLDEKIRGSKVRYWEDVEVGDEIPALVKGPISSCDEIAWCTAMESMKANSVALRDYRKVPGLAILHPATNAREYIESVHWDVEAGKTTGLPSAYDLGAQRQSWLIQSITHWMGDEGWVKRSSALYRRFLYVSDVVWIKGKVTKKYVDDEGECCVDIESTCINQRGENALHPALSTVALPSREKGTWPVEKRLSTSFPQI